ncbi:MAG: hypothetical protein KAI72_06335, partial [Candidatus Pacebacteria bacterium]|nr:hypothetical protein [Candidatus Paceibacterota bacterium]
IETEVVIAHSLVEGYEQLEKWAAQGYAADIIDVDYCVAELSMRCVDESAFKQKIKGRNFQDRMGVEATQFLIEWGQEQPEHLRPRKFFMHSLTVDMIWPHIHNDEKFNTLVSIHDTLELRDITNMGKYGLVTNKCSRLFDNRSTTLRKYLNKTFGTNYLFEKRHIEMALNPDKQIDIGHAYSDVMDDYITQEKAIAKIDTSNLVNLFRNHLDEEQLEDDYLSDNCVVFNKGIRKTLAGRAAFTAEDIQVLLEQSPHEAIVLIVNEFEPKDTALLENIDGVVLLGKFTGHLEMITSNHDIAGVFNSLDNDLKIQDQALTYNTPCNKEITIKTGEWVTLDSNFSAFDDDGQEVYMGELYAGKLPIRSYNIKEINWYDDVMSWVDKVRQDQGLKVKANADTSEQIERAIDLGAEGIGLLRTEHMFFDKDRLPALQDVLLTTNIERQHKALDILGRKQKDDFVKIFQAANKAGDAFPVSIRLLDAPPEEFLPSDQIENFRGKVGRGNERGSQLALQIPGLYAMQAEAIFEAAKEADYKGTPEIMLPLIRTPEEVEYLKAEIDTAAEKYGFKDRYRFGSMIETLDAVNNAGEIAKQCHFLSFGTNDLTTETLGGIKRNNIVATRKWMIENGHRDKCPFNRLAELVKEYMKTAIAAARKSNPDIEIGICGHQVAGDDQ